MKNIVTIIITAILGAVTLAIIMSVSGRMNRSMEIKTSLSSAVEETVEIMAGSGRYSIHNMEEYLADLIENIAAVLDTDSGITVQILMVDQEKGMLSVRVTETYQHPNRKTGTVECDRTVIIDKAIEQEDKGFQVKFYLSRADLENNANSYKKYRVLEGDSIEVPVNPSVEEKNFMGWKDANDYVADFTQPVTQDLTYYAEWR